MTQLHTITFRVVPSPETNDHEVEIFVDGNPFINGHWPEMMGMDPDDVLSYDKLVPRDDAHKATVVRCGCGHASCGSARVRISANQNRVIWDSWAGIPGNPSPEALEFDRAQYMQAVKDAVEDHSWETPDRSAARILATLGDRAALTRNSLKYQWASGRIRDDVFTVSLEGPPGCHQILVHLPWHKQSPEEIAREAAELLKSDPNQWPDVAWNGKDLTPPFTGPAWR